MERYDRQIRIFGFGVEGQSKLKRSSVAVFGVGGLGSISSMYLAAAGVGKLVLVDRDRVSETDLNRQLLYKPSDVGSLKVEVARQRLKEMNPEVDVKALAVDVESPSDIRSVVEEMDVVVDGLDNFKARFKVSDEAYRAGKPFIHGAVYEFEGRLTTIIPRETPCLRCVLGNPTDVAGIVPVMGATAGVIGSLQALEAVKLISGYGEVLKGEILIFSGEDMRFHKVGVDLTRRCSLCSTGVAHA
ncbi:MAG: adenylyltransferase [Thermoprotei archaeon]|nr:MAG: adenylyltransferase [Thermoprotei archaeon]RLF21564.1 MAG: adenylyltransferase [Thermoprotei archaeon]